MREIILVHHHHHHHHQWRIQNSVMGGLEIFLKNLLLFLANERNNLGTSSSSSSSSSVADPELGYGGVLRFFWKIFLNGGPNYFFTPFFPKIYPFFKELTFFWISMGDLVPPTPPWIRHWSSSSSSQHSQLEISVFEIVSLNLHS